MIGARVVASSRNEAISDAGGQYSLTKLDPERESQFIRVYLEGYPVLSARVSTRVGGEAHQDFVLQRGVGVVGHVRDEAGRPLPTARAFIESTESVAGDDGRFEFSAVKPGKRRLVVECRGYAPVQRFIEVPSDGSPLEDLSVVLNSAHFIAGNLQDDLGQPSPGVGVSARYFGEYLNLQTKTDDRGRSRRRRYACSERGKR